MCNCVDPIVFGHRCRGFRPEGMPEMPLRPEADSLQDQLRCTRAQLEVARRIARDVERILGIREQSAGYRR